MDRLACVELPAFPLQLLLRQHPDWAGWPAAVVDEDKPQGLVRWVNRKARQEGVAPGLRYGPALSLSPGLRAGTISESAVQEGVRALTERLIAFSPEVEPSEREPGVFWLDAGGLGYMFLSPEAWAQALRQDLEAAGYVAAVVVGFRRFGTYAAARALSGRRAIAFETPAEEAAAAMGVSLSLLGLPPGVRDGLAKLGVRCVGELLRLSAHGVGKRFGPEALALHRFASGDRELPLSPVRIEAPVEAHVALDYRETNAERLVFVAKPLVDRLLAELARRGRALTELELRLALEDAPERLERIRTAEPTLSSVTVMELVKLRLTAGPLAAPAVGLAVAASSVPATPEQLRMFAEAPRRDPAAAARAFARLRAAFGLEDVVVRAVMRDRHSPEGCFAWEPLFEVAMPHPHPPGEGALVRHLLSAPAPIAFSPAHAAHLDGPYRLSGGWWRGGLDRDYYFAELKGGDLLWVFFDRARRRWFLHGEFR